MKKITKENAGLEEQLRDFMDRLDHEAVGTLFDSLETLQFWIKDAEGRYLRANRAFLLNYSLAGEEELIGLTDRDLSPPWLADTFREDDRRVLGGESILNRIELVGGVDMNARWSSTTKIPVRDFSGRIAATAGTTRALPRLDAPDFPVPGLAPVLAALQREPGKQWTNPQLAKLAGTSISAFERSFRKHLRISPMRFLRELRLARVADSLLKTRNPIAEIALDLGFSDQSHLSRDFRKKFKATPGQWRRKHGGK